MIYPKIKNVYKRDPDTHKLTEEFSTVEFKYLSLCPWEVTEKVDGTNIRMIWTGEHLVFKGRTDRAEIPDHLLDHLLDFDEGRFSDLFGTTPAVIYGEGYGAKIQSGHKYMSGVSYIVFDINIGDVWLRRNDVEEIATKLGLRHVPNLGVMSLLEAIRLARNGFESKLGRTQAEGVVVRPLVELSDRLGNRIIAKVKTLDKAW